MTRAYKNSREHWGALRTLRSGRFQASYIGPDEKRHPKTFATKTAARRWLTNQRAAIENGTWSSKTDSKVIRFGDCATDWIEERVTKRGQPLRENVKENYHGYVARGLAPFANAPVTDITPAHLRKWHAARVKVAPTTAAREAMFMRAVLNTAVADEVIQKNPVRPELTKTSTGRTHRAPTKLEYQGMLQHMDRVCPRLTLALIIAGRAGVRLSEWRALRRRDVIWDGERYFISIVRQAYISRRDTKRWIIAPPKSDSGSRVLPLPTDENDRVREHLKSHVAKAPDALIFPPFGGGDFLTNQQFLHRWTKVREAVGVSRTVEVDGETQWEHDVTEHDLRAYASTALAQAGATLKETMDFLGQSSVTAALLYQRDTGRAASLVDRTGG